MWKSTAVGALKFLGLYTTVRRIVRKRRLAANHDMRSRASTRSEVETKTDSARDLTPPTAPTPVAPTPVAPTPAVPPRPAFTLPPILTKPLPLTPPGSLGERLAYIVQHPQFNRLVEALSAWPDESTIAASERAILYWLITSRDMQNVLEIGTYFAGTTYLMAAAMEAKASGKVYTTDPYGRERVPLLLQKWPEALANRVVFDAKYSTEFLLLMNNFPDFDLILIDGNHSYANAFHDISASVENSTTEGILVVDNAEQPDVIDATRDFLRLNPHLESVVIRQVGKQAHCSTVSEYDGITAAFAVIQVNRRYLKPNKTYTYFAFQLRRLAIGEVSAHYRGTKAVSGIISLSIHLRAIPQDSLGNSEMFDIAEQHDFPISKQAEGSFSFQSGLVLPDRAANYSIWAECSLRLNSETDIGIEEFTLKLGGKTLKMGRNFL